MVAGVGQGVLVLVQLFSGCLASSFSRIEGESLRGQYPRADIINQGSIL